MIDVLLIVYGRLRGYDSDDKCTIDCLEATTGGMTVMTDVLLIV